MKLAIVINQSPADISAHMLYICRLAEGLATSQPQNEIHLIFPAPAFKPEILGISQPTNLFLHPLFAVRKRKRKADRKKLSEFFTLNFIFYKNCRKLLAELQPDVVFSASFNKLWEFLLKHRKELPKTKFVYEVHDLVELNRKHGEGIKKKREFHREMDALEGSDSILTTTRALYKRLAHYGLLAEVLPLACAYNPDEFESAPQKKPNEVFRVGYIGSTYSGQGIDWLTKNWRAEFGELHIVGGNFTGVNVVSYGRLTMERIKTEVLPKLDALVIPSMNVGRMPFVAITKSYDYLAFKRPIIAADLPSITEVLRDGEDALIFKAGEIESFAQALGKLKADSRLCEKLVENATRRARELSWGKRCERFWEVI